MSDKKIEVLVAAVDENPVMLAEHMNLQTEAIICNQCHLYAYEQFEHNGRMVRVFSLDERGVGLNRNTALQRTDAGICVFSDEDIVYDDGYEQKILDEFRKNPKADVLMFTGTITGGIRPTACVRGRRASGRQMSRSVSFSGAVRATATGKIRCSSMTALRPALRSTRLRSASGMKARERMPAPPGLKDTTRSFFMTAAFSIIICTDAWRVRWHCAFFVSTGRQCAAPSRLRRRMH